MILDVCATRGTCHKCAKRAELVFIGLNCQHTSQHTSIFGCRIRAVCAGFQGCVDQTTTTSASTVPPPVPSAVRGDRLAPERVGQITRSGRCRGVGGVRRTKLRCAACLCAVVHPRQAITRPRCGGLRAAAEDGRLRPALLEAVVPAVATDEPPGGLQCSAQHEHVTLAQAVAPVATHADVGVISNIRQCARAAVVLFRPRARGVVVVGSGFRSLYCAA